jgi:hypothetical protein
VGGLQHVRERRSGRSQYLAQDVVRRSLLICALTFLLIAVLPTKSSAESKLASFTTWRVTGLTNADNMSIGLKSSVHFTFDEESSMLGLYDGCNASWFKVTQTNVFAAELLEYLPVRNCRDSTLRFNTVKGIVDQATLSVFGGKLTLKSRRGQLRATPTKRPIPDDARSYIFIGYRSATGAVLLPYEDTNARVSLSGGRLTTFVSVTVDGREKGCSESYSPYSSYKSIVLAQFKPTAVGADCPLQVRLPPPSLGVSDGSYRLTKNGLEMPFSKGAAIYKPI